MPLLTDLCRPWKRLVPKDFVQPTPEQLAELGREQNARLRAEHERKKEAETEKHLIACGVEDEVRAGLLRARLLPSTARAQTQSFIRDPELFALILLGPAGPGKTLAACEAFLSLKATIDTEFGKTWTWGRPGAFVKASRMANMSRYDEKEELRRLATAPLLVVDDLGLDEANFVPRFDALIDERYASRKKIIITGNLVAKDIGEKYGERVRDRFKHRGRIVECADPSFRTRKP